MVFFKEVCLQLLPEYLLPKQVSASYAAPSSLVFICRADSPSGSSYLQFAADPFPDRIQPLMIRHYKMRVFAYNEVAVIPEMPPFPQGNNLIQQDVRVNNYAVSYYAPFAAVKYAGWNKVQDKLFVAYHHRSEEHTSELQSHVNPVC